MITAQTFYGGATIVSLNGSNKVLNHRQARIWRVQLGSGIADVILPVPDSLMFGTPHFLIVNATGGTLIVRSQSGVIAVTLPINQACQVGLVSRSTPGGLWAIQVKPWSAA